VSRAWTNDLERAAILAALKGADGSLCDTARNLKMNYRTFNHKLDHLGLRAVAAELRKASKKSRWRGNVSAMVAYLDAVKKHRGCMKATAAELGISPNVLRSRLREMGIMVEAKTIRERCLQEER